MTSNACKTCEFLDQMRDMLTKLLTDDQSGLTVAKTHLRTLRQQHKDAAHSARHVTAMTASAQRPLAIDLCPFCRGFEQSIAQLRAMPEGTKGRAQGIAANTATLQRHRRKVHSVTEPLREEVRS